MDCTDYNSKSCPKGNTIINTLNTDNIKTFMVGCWVFIVGMVK